jgi:2-polyprenyl-3-methyl-5-hydroxy-6-metoxy-1,4-benzoquinol methylase
MTSKYETELSLDNRNNSHTLILELIGRDKRVLDVGTATGYLAEVLTERGCRVTGIEIDPEAARQAEEHCERVIVGDVETLELHEELEEGSFDVILFGDVLEHLKDPLRTLKRSRPFLSPEGYVVTSIPNVAHGSVRLALLQGRFPYHSLGLLDNTHLRFFTRESIEHLFNEAGFLIGEIERTRRGIFDTEIEVDRGLVAGETLRAVQNAPEAQTYQFVLTAHPSGEAGTIAKLSNRARLLSEQLAQRDAEIQKLNEKNLETDGLRQQLNEQQNAHDEQLAARDQTIFELNNKIRNFNKLQNMLDNRTEQLAEREREIARLIQEVAKRNNRLAKLEQPRRGNK